MRRQKYSSLFSTVSLTIRSSHHSTLLQDLLPGPDPLACKYFAHDMTSERWTNLICFPLLLYLLRSKVKKRPKSISKRICARGLQTDLIPENPEDPTQQGVRSRLCRPSQLQVESKSNCYKSMDCAKC